jgi:hypothetical protein
LIPKMSIKIIVKTCRPTGATRRGRRMVVSMA